MPDGILPSSPLPQHWTSASLDENGAIVGMGADAPEGHESAILTFDSAGNLVAVDGNPEIPPPEYV